MKIVTNIFNKILSCKNIFKVKEEDLSNLRETNRYKLFKENFDSYIEEIDEFLRSDQDNQKEFKHLAVWLFNRKGDNRSIFVKYGYLRKMDNPEGFLDILNEIYNGLLDDGDICFPVVNGSPRIAFANKYDDDILNKILDDTELFILNDKKVSMEASISFRNKLQYYFLNNAYEFTEAYEEYINKK